MRKKRLSRYLVKKKRKRLLLLGYVLFMVVGISTQYKPTNVASSSSVTINNNDGTGMDQLIPADSLTRNTADSLPTGDFVQGQGFKESLVKGNIYSYSSKTADRFFADPYYLPNGRVIFSIMHRNSGEEGDGNGSIYYISLFYTEPDGKIIDQISVATGGSALSPTFEKDTAATSHYATEPSDIWQVGTNQYQIQYKGYTPSSQSTANIRTLRTLNFSIVNDRIKTTANSWQNIAYVPAKKPGSETIKAHYLYGTNKIITHGTIDRNQLDAFEIFQLNAAGNYQHLIDLKLDSASIGSGKANSSNDIGFNAKTNGYYGVNTISSSNGFSFEKFQLRLWDQTGLHSTILDSVDITQKSEEKNMISIVKKSANEKGFYYTKSDNHEVGLYYVDLTVSSPTPSKKLALPYRSNVKIEKDGTNFVIYGKTEGASSFLGLSESSVFIARLDSDYSLKHVNSIKLTGTYDIYDLNVQPNGDYFITGNGTTRDFATVLPTTGWQELTKPSTNPNRATLNNASFGSIRIEKDYFPGIDTSKPITLDISTSRTESQWDNDLLKDIKVYDVYDLEQNISGTKTQDWLNERINRNPRDSNINQINHPNRLAIDWSALGLTKNKRGPQTVKYFITDSNNDQITASSRLVNQVDNETDYDSSNPLGALAASNFNIHVDDLNTLTITETKKLAKVLAWDLNDGTIIDDGTGTEVKVNEAQLKIITDVKDAYQTNLSATDKENLIKPYELEITMTYQGKNLKRTILIFITDDTTTVNKNNQVVLYGFDFEEWLKNTKTISSSKVVALAHANAWNFKLNPSKEAVTPYSQSSITVTNLNTPKNPTNLKETGLHQIDAIGQYEIQLVFEHNGVKTSNDHATRKVLADIKDAIATIHIRQVIIDENSALVTPQTGFLSMENTNTLSSGSTITNAKFETEKDDLLAFNTTLNLQMSFDYWFYQLNIILPEYYEYSGHLQTAGAAKPTHQANDLPYNAAAIKPLLDFTEEDEYWVSIYLKPSTTTPRPYNWDYQKNIMGKLP